MIRVRSQHLMLSVILSYLFASLTIPPQTPTAAQRPSFEVASIKPYAASAPGTPQFRGFQNQPGGRVRVTGIPLKGIITFSCGVRDFRVSDGPDWINADLSEIVAKAEDGAIPRDPSF